MSATNRGSTRKPHDFYPTPIPTIETFLDVFPLRGGIEVLEPGAGSGNIIKTLQKYGDFSIDAVEIRPEEAQHLQDLGVNVIIDDFLSMDLGKKYDLIIGNTPFNQAIEFVEKCLGLLKPGGRLIFLLRTAFMESDQRFEFWQQEDHQLAGVLDIEIQVFGPPEFIENVLEIYNHAAVTQRRPLRKLAASAAAAYADQPAAAPLLAEAGKSLREVTAVHVNIDPTEASELGEMIANSLKNGNSMLRGGA